MTHESGLDLRVYGTTVSTVPRYPLLVHLSLYVGRKNKILPRSLRSERPSHVLTLLFSVLMNLLEVPVTKGTESVGTLTKMVTTTHSSDHSRGTRPGSRSMERTSTHTLGRSRVHSPCESGWRVHSFHSTPL